MIIDGCNVQRATSKYLSTIEIFRDLSLEELAAMERQILVTTCASGKIFYTPDETGEVLFLVKKGRVQLYRLSPNGKKLVLATLGPGAIFGEMSFVGQRMHNSFAQAIDECTLCIMRRADVERLMREKPDVAVRFLEALGSRLSEVEQQMEEIAFKSIPARLANLLLRLADEQTQDEVIGFTHQEFGEMLGTYRETITQALNEFRAEGMVEIGRKRIFLQNRHALEELAES